VRVLAVIAAVLLTGCSTQYVVLRQVPESPAFAVIPGSVSKANMDFANSVTSVLISCGVRVLERPAMLSGYSESQTSGSGSAVGSDIAGGLVVADVTGSSKGETSAQTVDVVELYERTSADYVVVAFANSSYLKIVRRDSKEVLFAGPLKRDRNDDHPKKTMQAILGAMGIKVPK
jgi:hypothetical protein